MPYLRCPSCGKSLGDVQIEYEKFKEDTLVDQKLTEDEVKELNKKFFEKHKIKRYCCRMRLTTTIDLTNLIK